MISTKALIIKANEQIAGTLTEEQVTQLTAIDDALRKNKLVVGIVGDLPSAVNNRGRLVYVSSDDTYYFSDGSQWLSDYSTFFSLISSVTFGWGLNNAGQAGDDTRNYRSSPVTVVGVITNWISLSAGSRHSMGITSDGIAYTWGDNGTTGQLGDGTINISRSSPVTVVGGITNWSQVSAGSNHSLGLTSDGLAYAWGFSSNGQLGAGTIISRSSPVTVVGGITNWSQLSAGSTHSLGVTADGIAYAWGFSGNGQLGDGTNINRSSPVTVIGGITNWSQVSAGSTHSLGVTADGIAYAWGGGFVGVLGDGTTITKSSPVTVIGGITNWSQVSAGTVHNIGITTTGIAYAWGANSIGELGDRTNINKSSPVTVAGGITNWSQVSAGLDHSLGLTDNGILYSWGGNTYFSSGFGALGDGTIIDRSSPVTVVGGITNWSQISAGHSSSIAISTQSKGFNTP